MEKETILEYKNDKIIEYIKENELTCKQLLELLGMTNYKTISRWTKENDIRMSHFVNVVNTFHLNVRDFFTENGVLLRDIEQEQEKTHIQTSATKNLMDAEKKIMQLEMQLMEKEVERAKAEMETKQIKAEMEMEQTKAKMELERIKAEIEMERNVREEIKNELNQNKELTEARYERIIRDKEKQIERLHEELTNMAVECSTWKTKYNMSKGESQTTGKLYTNEPNANYQSKF